MMTQAKVRDAPSNADAGVSYTNRSDAQIVRDLILQSGLSQRGAARELDVEDRTVRYWCSGERPVPKIAILALERLRDMHRQLNLSSAR